MKQTRNFLLLELNEFRSWLQKQVVTRKIKKLQAHHTASPNYTTRKIVNGVAQQDHFACLEGMRNYHINSNGWRATGQNITIFEDGKVAISLDRNLNHTPAGITGANTGAICVEIIGNFDKFGDTMTVMQKQAVAHVFASLCEKFNIKPTTENMPYHCWFTSKGDYIGDYLPARSAKSCPGTNFLGEGNTKAAAYVSFIPLVKNEIERLKEGESDVLQLSNYQWNKLKENVEQLLKEKVITSNEWAQKVENKTLTNSELNWLNNEVLMRLRK